VIGARLVAKDAEHGTWIVSGTDGGRWIVAREDQHTSPESLTTEEVAQRFEVKPSEVSDPAPADEAAGWRALADANGRASLRLAYLTNPEDFEPNPETPEHDKWRRRVAAARPKPGPSPEDHFEHVSDADARRLGHK
jgi:hypothetical protein